MTNRNQQRKNPMHSHAPARAYIRTPNPLRTANSSTCAPPHISPLLAPNSLPAKHFHHRSLAARKFSTSHYRYKSVLARYGAIGSLASSHLLLLSCVSCLSWLAPCLAQQKVTGPPLAGTAPLTMEGDIAAQMVAGIDKFLLREIELSVQRREKFW